MRPTARFYYVLALIMVVLIACVAMWFIVSRMVTGQLGIVSNPPLTTEIGHELQIMGSASNQVTPQPAGTDVPKQDQVEPTILKIDWSNVDLNFDQLFVGGRYPDSPNNPLIDGWTEFGALQEVRIEGGEGYVFMSSDPGTLRFYKDGGENPTDEAVLGGNGFLLVAYMSTNDLLTLDVSGWQGNPETGGHYPTWAEEKFLRQGVNGEPQEVMRWIMAWYDLKHEEKDNMLLLLPSGKFLYLRHDGVNQ